MITTRAFCCSTDVAHNRGKFTRRHFGGIDLANLEPPRINVRTKRNPETLGSGKYRPQTLVEGEEDRMFPAFGSRHRVAQGHR